MLLKSFVLMVTLVVVTYAQGTCDTTKCTGMKSCARTAHQTCNPTCIQKTSAAVQACFANRTSVNAGGRRIARQGGAGGHQWGEHGFDLGSAYDTCQQGCR